MKWIPLAKVGIIIAFVFNNFINKIPISFIRNIYLFIWIKKYPIKSNFPKYTYILNGRKISIGDSVFLEEGCLLDGRKYSITIGSNVFIGASSSILTLQHDSQSKIFSDRGGDVIIEDFVEIGSKVIILPKVRIGHHSKILSGSVILRDVHPYSLVGGNPCNIIRKV